MNKKAVKYVLIVSGIVLLLGLGIWGYKYIKNRNDDKRTNENETELKELANLTSYGSSTVVGGNFTLNYYYNGPIDMGQTCLVGKSDTYSNGSVLPCFKYNYYLTIYVDNVKLKSSWMFYSYESANFNLTSSGSYLPSNTKYITKTVFNSKFLMISLPNFTYCRITNVYDITCDSTSETKKVTYYPYTKVFDVTTGDMIFAVPTNGNEDLSKSVPSGTYGTCTKFTNNMCLTDSDALYYLKSVYENGSSKVEVRKVTFSDSYYTNDHPFKYLDEVAKPN